LDLTSYDFSKQKKRHVNNHLLKSGHKGEMRIVLIGSGRLAQALARTMPERIVALYGNDVQRLQGIHTIANNATISTSLDDLRETECDAIWIATADRDIKSFCVKIAEVRDSWKGVVAVHSSGAVPLTSLEVFHQRGGGILALHPNVSLTGDEPIPEELLWSVASDGVGDDFPQLLLEGLQPRLVVIDEDLRPLYHAAASAAANYSVTLFALAKELYRRAGVTDDDARTTVTRFMLQSIERSSVRGPKGSITGPVVRGDTDVVREQMRLVRAEAPEFYNVFRSLAEATALLFTDSSNELWREFFQHEAEERNHSDSGSPRAQSGQSAGE
jgi:predicted short-subunit dehydrogenase-like oxidoreductase (DUF2520 family)